LSRYFLDISHIFIIYAAYNTVIQLEGHKLKGPTI